MKIKSLSFIGVLLLTALLILSCAFLWQIKQYDVGSQNDFHKYSMFLNKYKISRSSLWNTAFASSSQRYTNLPFEEKGTQLIIGSKYVAEIGHLDEHYEQQTISDVIEVSNSLTQRKHFIVRSQGNQQLFYLPQGLTEQQNKGLRVEKCLELDNIELKDKIDYFVDKQSNFWLISHPHNNVLFVQIYDCREKRLVKKIYHQPEHNNRKYMINQFIDIKSLTPGFYQVSLLTYESHEYKVQIAQKDYEISSVSLNPSYQILSQQLQIKEDNDNGLSYKFLDPLNKIFERQFYYVIFKTVQNYMSELKTLLGLFGVDTKQLNTFIREKIRQYEKEKDPEYFDYDLQLADQNNDCLINLQYHIANQSHQNSSLTRLSKYLLDTRTPVFHSIENYDQYDIVQILKNQKTPKVNQFKRISLDKGYEKLYTSNYFYSIYHTYPDSKVHFLGVGEKVFYLYPNEASNNEQYLNVRTNTGGLVLQGSRIKGAYEDRPLNKNEVRQKYYIEANQVIHGIWQAHAGYQALYSVLNGNKVELVNGLNGKTLLSYEINTKEGYSYAESYLFNNEWWIVIFNKHSKMSELVKHQLYVEKAYPKQVDTIRRVYGQMSNSQLQEEQDDLRQIFREYASQVSSNGIIILDIFKCLDQFYYIQICDTKGENYAIARIHFKRLSNRNPKKNSQYSSDLEKRLIVQPKKMVKETQSMDPFLLVLQGQQFYQGISELIKQGNFNFKNYSTKSSTNEQKVITSLKKLNQFDFLPYAIISEQNKFQVPDQSIESVQKITLLNMRVLVENAKKKFMLDTKILARNRLMYLTIFVIIILVCSFVKIIISKDLSKIREERQSQNKKGEEKDNSVQKSKKKQKTK